MTADVLQPEQTPTDDLERELNRYHDRCDRCGAQAFVIVTLKNGGELMFCGHHYHENEPALVGIQSVVHDFRALINETSASSV